MWQKSIQRAWSDTLAFFGWTRRQIIWPVLFGVGWLIHNLWAKSAAAPEEELILWATYTLAPIAAFALLLFLWNLFCAPFRIERDARKAAEARLAVLGGQEPDWKVWRERSHYSVREAGFLLAGEEPHYGPLRGAALARFQELKWAIDEGKITPEISQFIISNYRHSLQFGPHPRLGETPFRDDWKIRREALLVYIIERGTNIPDSILSNLGADDLALLRRGIGEETQPKTRPD